MKFGAAQLDAVLDAHLPTGVTGLVAGVSGGSDSASLLHALVELGRRPLRAIHIDHGLQAAAGPLRASCAALCQRLRVPLTEIEVEIDAAGESIEAAARDARYRAFARDLAPGECLVTAHHAEDQAETMLLQLFRGAGVKGLSAMPVRRPLGQGWHLRPLLQVARAELDAYGSAHGLEPHEDPMNRDPRFDRAYLRSELWPAIVRRWPGAAQAIGRAAGHAADAQQLLDRSADLALQHLRDGDGLSIPRLRVLPENERINVLRRWLGEAGIAAPPAARLSEGLRQIFTAEADHAPTVEWGAYALRRYRDRLFRTPDQPPVLAVHRDWPMRSQAPCDLGDGLGTLRWVRRAGGLNDALLPDRLGVRRRRGGESLKPGAQARTQSVQHLCQAMGVLPWMRDALPFIYAGEQLIAIGDIWQDARWQVGREEAGYACVWEGAPALC